ncbi:MAG TPA: GNAT family N-acetyltransferase [Solirubrobacteraceae bacterium]|nr:GNAT family N-acetyltransferase [Solirubrobacteraceae bacterium]
MTSPSPSATKRSPPQPSTSSPRRASSRGAGERRRGLARRLMAEIERRAREHRLRELRLDTRADLVAARALYERIGYREVPRFSDTNPYAGHWFAKRLD